MSGKTGQKSQQKNTSAGVISLEDIPLRSTNLLSLLDEDGVVQYQSPSVERLLAFDHDELVGVSCTEVFHPDDRERVYEAFENVVSTDEYVVEAIEYRHLTGDGTYLWVESVTSSHPTSEGYYVINTRDISAQKQQREELERANERLREFADIVSHDLRNPLSIVSGRLKRARRKHHIDELETMVDPLDRMSRMIEKLRTLTKHQRHAARTTPMPIASRAEAAWSTTETGDSQLRILLDPGVEYEADFGLLDHVFENLFRNAVVHNPEPVTVTVGPLAERSGFYVADDGSGIPADQVDDVLEYGYSTAGEGTGIGLTIVADFVEAHGWELAVTGSADDGARFEIRVD